MVYRGFLCLGVFLDKNTIVLLKSKRIGFGIVIGVKWETARDEENWIQSVNWINREQNSLTFIFRIVAETYLFNWCIGSINAMEMLTVSPDCSRKLKACLEVVRKMNWMFYSDQCWLSFLLCIYWSLKCTPEGTKDIWALWVIKDKRYFPLFFRRKNFCVSPRWSPPESRRLVHWKLSFPWGNVTLNKTICVVSIKSYHLPIFQDIIRLN